MTSSRQAAATKGPVVPGAQVVDAVALELGARLFDGTYGPGTRLPPERELSGQLGASRVSVRSALQRLSSWRMLDVRHGSGATVRPRRHWSFAALPALVRHAVARGEAVLLGEVVREALHLRRVLITELLCGAAHRPPPGALDEARAEVRRAFAARKQYGDFLAHDLEMNRLVLEACGLKSPLWLLNSVADAYLDLVASFPAMLPVPPDYQTANLKVLDALEAGDRRRARELSAAYLERHDARVLDALGVT